MKLFGWDRLLRWGRIGQKVARRNVQTLRGCRVAAERLESRVVLTQHTWSGLGETLLWSDAGNWIGGAPSASDADVQLFFPSNAAIDFATLGPQSITAKNDITFQHPLTSITFTGPLGGSGFEVLGAPEPDAALNLNYQISNVDAGAFVLAADGPGLRVAAEGPTGATLLEDDADLRGVFFHSPFVVESGVFNVHLEAAVPVRVSFRQTVSTVGDGLSELRQTGSGELSTHEATDFDLYTIAGGTFVTFSGAGAFGPSDATATIQLVDSGRIETQSLVDLSAFKTVRFSRSAPDVTGSPGIVAQFGDFKTRGDVQVDAPAQFSGNFNIDISGTLSGDHDLTLRSLVGQPNGAGIVVLRNANPGFTGDFHALAGTLQLDDTEALGAATTEQRITLGLRAGLTLTDGVVLPATKSISAGRLSRIVAFADSAESPDIAILGNITATSASTLEFFADANTTLRLEGRLIAPGQVVRKTGNGTVRLMNDNDYRSGTVIDAGRLSIEHPDALGSGPVEISAGTLQFELAGEHEFFNAIVVAAYVENTDARLVLAEQSAATTITLSSPGGILADSDLNLRVEGAADRLVIGASIAGDGSVTKVGAGTLQFAMIEDNSFAGPTRVLDGVLELRQPDDITEESVGNLIPGDLLVGSGGADDSARLISRQTFSAGDATVDQGGTIEFDVGVSGSFDSLTMSGGRIVQPDNPNEVQSLSVAGAITVEPSANPSRLEMSLSIESESQQFVIEPDATLIVARPLKNGGAVTQSGGGTLVFTERLTRGSDVLSDVVVESGTLQLAAPPAPFEDGGEYHGALSGTLHIRDGATVEMLRSKQLGPRTEVTIDAGGTLNFGNAEGLVTGVGHLTLNGGLIELGVFNYLALADGATLNGGIITSGDFSALTFSPAANDIIDIVVTAPTGVFGTGVFDLNGFDREIDVTAGTDEAPGFFSIDVPLFDAGGVLATGDDEADGGIIIPIPDVPAGSLVKLGQGILQLNADSSFDGDAVIENGLLEVNGAVPLNAIPDFVVLRDDEGSVQDIAEGTLGGIGAVGSISMAGGTVNPGSVLLNDGVGPLTVLGDVVSVNGIRVEVEEVLDEFDSLLIEFENTITELEAFLAELPANSEQTEATRATLEATRTQLLQVTILFDTFGALLDQIPEPGDLTGTLAVDVSASVIDSLPFDVLNVQGSLDLTGLTMQVNSTFDGRLIDLPVVVVGNGITGELVETVGNVPTFVTTTDTHLLLSSVPTFVLPETGGRFALTLEEDFLFHVDGFDDAWVLRDLDVNTDTDPDANVLRAILFDHADTVFVSGSDQDDSLTIDISLGIDEGESKSVTFDAGGGFDTLRFVSLDGERLSVNPLGPDSGDLEYFATFQDDLFDNVSLLTDFVGLESLDISRSQTFVVDLNLTDDDDDVIVEEFVPADEFGPAVYELSSLDATFVPVLFEAPDASLVSLNGRDGNDRIELAYASLAIDESLSVNGDDGNDLLTGSAGPDFFSGGNGRDTLRGNDGDDILHGNGDNDLLIGGNGDDVLSGGDGNDSIRGEQGADDLSGDAGNDTLDGGSGTDKLFESILGDEARRLTLTNTTLRGHGDDRLISIEQAQLIVRGGNDLLDARTFSGPTTLTGGGGNDTLFGGLQADLLFGGEGNDQLNGSRGHDTLHGDEGNDLLLGSTDNDVLKGGDGNDRLNGQGGHDSLSGGAGNDAINGEGGTDLLFENLFDNPEVSNITLTGTTLRGLGQDTLASIESAALVGNDNDNVLDATRFGGLVTLLGEGGDDRLLGGTNKNVLVGGDGNDSLQGNRLADTLLGEGGRDTLLGAASNDVLLGGDDDDSLVGGIGTDTLAGNGGLNTFDTPTEVREAFTVNFDQLLTALEDALNA